MRSMVVALMGLSCTTVLHADILPSFLNSNDPERNLPTTNLPPDTFRPRVLSLEVPAPPDPGQPLPMDARVVIHKVRFEGGTVYALSELRENYQPLVGRETSMAELVEATRRLTRRYQHDGYLMSYAYLPPQDLAEGRLRVVLVEGYIRDYQLQGDVGPVSAYLESLMEKLKAERPLTRQTFDRYATLMSRVPGVTFQAEVRPPDGVDGATLLRVRASRTPFTANLTASDGSRDDPQALLGLGSNAQTQSGEQLKVSGLISPGADDERYLRADYSQYLDSEGTQLHLSALTYRSDPATRVPLAGDTNLRQKRESARYAVGLSQALTASSGEWLEAHAYFYAVNDRFDYRVEGSGLKTDTSTQVRALAFEGDWRQVEARRLRLLTGGVYQGLDQFGADTDADYDLDFLRVRLAGMQSDNWLEHGQGVVSAALYWSDDSLPYSERAVFGGQHFGRGYPVDQASGDKGWGASYELNYRLLAWQPYVVLDAARTWFNRRDVREAQLSSLALGVRFGDARYYNIALEAAKPMSDVALDSFNRRPRFTLSFSYQL